MPSGSDDRIDTLRRKITGLHALASNRSATSAEAASARQTAQRLERELAQLLDQASKPPDDETNEPVSYRAAPPSSARWPEPTARTRAPRTRGIQRPSLEPIDPAPNGWLSKIAFTIPPLLVLAGFLVYRVQHEQELKRAAAERVAAAERAAAQPLAAQPLTAQPLAAQPLAQHQVQPSSAAYCEQAERELKGSFASSSRRWSPQLTFLSFAPRGCSGSFVLQRELAPRERRPNGAGFEAERSLSQRKLCGEALSRSALVEHGGVFSFRVHDRMGQLLTEFQIDGRSCDASPSADGAHEPPSPRR